MTAVSILEPTLADLRVRFDREGFCITPPIFPTELIDRVIPRMDAVIRGEYETGVPPHALHFAPEDGPEKLRKVDQPHLCDDAIFEFVSHPALGEWAAGIVGAKWVQAWAVQLLVKPPGGDGKGLVGWHQDKHYWPYWEGEAFTAWVALSDVAEESGPVRYVVGSHKWGFLEGSDFFGTDDSQQKEKLRLPEGVDWKETAAVMTPGQVVFHHRLTLHGSGPNLSSLPRRSFAIHLRTENCRPLFGATDFEYYIENLEDARNAPVIYDEARI